MSALATQSPGPPGDTVAALDSLTDLELKALEVMLDPQRYGGTMIDLAKAIGCDQQTLRKIRRRRPWQAAYRASVMLRLDRHLPKMLAAAITVASRADKDGHADRKMLFTMAGLYIERRSSVTPAQDDPDDDGRAPKASVSQRLETARRMMRTTVTESVEFGQDGDDDGPELGATVDAEAEDIEPF